MMDFHDEELVKWRSEMLGDVEEFCSSNMLSSAPRKFSAVEWLWALLSCAVFTIAGSYALNDAHAWLAGILGNISSGLVASFLILLYTTHKDKNVAYYESLLPALKAVVDKAQIAFNKLYFLQRELRQGHSAHYIENYNIFAMKVLLSHKMMLDLYRQVHMSDKLTYNKFLFDGNQLAAHSNAVDYYHLQIAIDCSKKNNERIDEFDSLYNNIWSAEMKMMRNLQGYIEFVQGNIYSMKYGKR